jgi:hypothetical protein
MSNPQVTQSQFQTKRSSNLKSDQKVLEKTEVLIQDSEEEEIKTTLEEEEVAEEEVTEREAAEEEAAEEEVDKIDTKNIIKMMIKKRHKKITKEQEVPTEEVKEDQVEEASKVKKVVQEDTEVEEGPEDLEDPEDLEVDKEIDIYKIMMITINNNDTEEIAKDEEVVTSFTKKEINLEEVIKTQEAQEAFEEREVEEVPEEGIEAEVAIIKNSNLN